jgi:hypothetical protein
VHRVVNLVGWSTQWGITLIVFAKYLTSKLYEFHPYEHFHLGFFDAFSTQYPGALSPLQRSSLEQYKVLRSESYPHCLARM